MSSERAERDGRPVKHDAPAPASSARHAPDVVERPLDVGEHRDGDVEQEQHPDQSKRLAARVLDELMDVFGDLLLRVNHAGIFGNRR